MSKSSKTKANPNRWYTEDDIADILNLLAPDNANVFAQTQFEHEDLLADNFQQAISNVVETGITQLMPIHLHGNHWAAAIVRMQANGNIQLIYNDPMGGGLESQPNAMKLVTAVQAVVNGVDIIDLRLRQQNNGNDCGPFTVDNLLRLAADNGLDGLDRDAIIRRKVLQIPLQGSAIEIRTQHADLLPRLEEDYVEDKSPAQLSAEKSYKSDSELWKDVKKLLILKQKISDLKNAVTDYERKVILVEIGEIAASIYRKDIDGSAIRNKFSSSQSDKRDILHLDVFELLTHLHKESGRLHVRLLSNSLQSIITDLDMISGNIDFVLSDQTKRIQHVAVKEVDKDVVLGQLSKIVAPTKTNDASPESLKNFIAAFYIPKALDRMRGVTPEQTAGFDWDNRVDRYYFARTFALLGELSRSVRYLLPEDAEQKLFFRDLNHIRNNLKKLAHIKFFSEGNQVIFTKDNGSNVLFVEDMTKLDEVKDSFVEVAANLDELQRLFTEANKVDDLKEIGEIFRKKLPNQLRALSEFAKILEGKNYQESKLITLIDQILSRRSQISEAEEKIKTSNARLSEFNSYKVALDLLDDALKTRLSLPKTLDEVRDFDLATIPVADKKSLASYMREFGKIKKSFPSQKTVDNLKQEYLDLESKYRQLYDDTDEEYRKDFPDPKDAIEIEEYLDLRKKELEDKQQKALVKAQKKSKEEKTDRATFSKYCQDFEKEAKRLESLLSFAPVNDEGRKRREFAIAHSIGIIGESIRFMFEIDSETNFLGEFAIRALSNDIDETRLVRNRQVMHGIFNYDAEAVLRAASNNTVPWKRDIKAISLVHQFTEIMSRDEEYLAREAAKLGMDSDKMQMRMMMFVGDAYFCLGKMDEAKEVLESAKSIAISDPDDGSIAEIIRINKFLAAIEKNIGNSISALDLINESLDYLDKHPEHNVRRSGLLNDKAVLLCESGDYEGAKELYREAIAQDSSTAILNLAQLLFEENRCEEAVKMLKDYFLKLNPDRMKKPFEFFHLVRDLWLKQSESGDLEGATKTFAYYVNFYRSNIPLFKETLGQGYSNVEAIILRDEAGEFYQKGHYRKAINRWENALSLLKESGFQTSEDSLQIHLNIANSYKYLASRFASDLSESAESRNYAIQHYQEVITNFESHDSLTLGHAYAGLSEIYAKMRKSDEAKDLSQKARAIFRIHGEIGNEYLQIMDKGLKVIEVGSNSRLRERGPAAGDEYAFLQGNLLEVNSAMKSGRYQEALVAIEVQLEESRRIGLVNPSVMQLKFGKFSCHCHLKEQKKALDTYADLEEMVEKYPDCADSSYRDSANRVFQSNFRSSLSSQKLPTGKAESAKASELAAQQHQQR